MEFLCPTLENGPSSHEHKDNYTRTPLTGTAKIESEQTKLVLDEEKKIHVLCLRKHNLTVDLHFGYKEANLLIHTENYCPILGDNMERHGQP